MKKISNSFLNLITHTTNQALVMMVIINQISYDMCFIFRTFFLHSQHITPLGLLPPPIHSSRCTPPLTQGVTPSRPCPLSLSLATRTVELTTPLLRVGCTSNRPLPTPLQGPPTPQVSISSTF